MARGRFGDSTDDFVYGVGAGGTVQVRSHAVTFWSAKTGGTQYADLLYNGQAVSSIQAPTSGQVPGFDGPDDDNVRAMWMDAGGARVLIYALGTMHDEVKAARDEVAEARAVVEGIAGSAFFDRIAAHAVTDTYTLVLGDAGKVVEANKATAFTITIPPESAVAWPAGTVLEVFQLGVGQITIAGGVGVALLAPFGAKTAAQYGSISLRKRAADTWVLSGDTTT